MVHFSEHSVSECYYTYIYLYFAQYADMLCTDAI